MSSQKPSKWGSSQWDVVKAAGALVSKPERTPAVQKAQTAKPAKAEASGAAEKASANVRPRVSVVQPNASYHMPRPFGGAERAAADRDARLGRRVIFGVLVITVLVFGTNYVGLWKSPGQQQAGKQTVRQEPERKPGAAREMPEKRIPSGQQKAYEETRPAPAATPAPARSALTGTDCQRSKSAAVAVAACSKIIAQQSENAEAYAVRGWALRERNQPERALTDFKRAIELEPRNASNYAQRGLTYSRMRDFDRALADYDKAIEIEPRGAGYYSDRGVIYMETKDYARASAEFNRAIELNPRYALAYNNRARVRVLVGGDHAAAIADLDRAIELDPRSSLAFENRGLSHLELKDLAKALADFNAAIEIAPRSARALNSRGVVHQRQGKRDLAIADYRRALDVDPNHRIARENLTALGEKP